MNLLQDLLFIVVMSCIGATVPAALCAAIPLVADQLYWKWKKTFPPPAHFGPARTAAYTALFSYPVWAGVLIYLWWPA
jgi:hypothetical protein